MMGPRRGLYKVTPLRNGERWVISFGYMANVRTSRLALSRPWNTLMIDRRMAFSGFGKERHVVSELPNILSGLFNFLSVPASSKKLRPYMILDWH